MPRGLVLSIMAQLGCWITSGGKGRASASDESLERFRLELLEVRVRDQRLACLHIPRSGPEELRLH